MNIPGYTLERRIGAGGQAMVYKAVQECLGRRVALKILNPLLADNAEFTGRFLNEGRILATVHHANVITIHDIGVVRDLHYLSMELVEGGDLRARMRAGLSPETVLDYVATIADCLGAAHAKRVVHRDIKPANVLFRRDGTLLLTDFGIAKRLGADDELTLTGTTLGSPGYLSPEQARNRPLDGRADIYSLGAMTFEMLSGRKPYDGASEHEIIGHHLSSPVPELPEALAAYQPLIERMMAKSPEDRFASAGELVEALRALRPGIPVRAAVPVLAETAAPSEDGVPDQAPDEAPDVASPSPEADDDEPTTRLDVAPTRPRRRVPLAATALLLGAATIAWAMLGGGDRADRETVSMAPAAALPAPPAPAIPRAEARATLPAPPAPAIPRAEARATSPALAAPAIPRAEARAALPHADPPPATPATSDEARVVSLLESARAALAELRLTTPPGDNARDYYAQALELDPGNAEALDGQRAIAERYASLVRTALDRGDAERARILAVRGLSVDADNASLLALSRQAEATPVSEPTVRREPVVQAASSRGEIHGESPAQLFRRVKGWFD